eukprot:CAMPEP_0168513800 /NCGR_PEP_ID=MMETSP0405-20121227/3707_1 /TAXON_ID=498012 /ORGANISM="Trichosphaerium sp, Strain Am-I-7 wt" /LENGTH=406 /DNA_ID=CAMNT_0008532759 /DNA_START=631 /DNA_END=1848 /DNA_ORIENTATION=+
MVGEACADDGECQSRNCEASKCAGMDCSQASCELEEECFIEIFVDRVEAICGDPKESCSDTQFWNITTYKCENRKGEIEKCAYNEDCVSGLCTRIDSSYYCVSTEAVGEGEPCLTDQQQIPLCQQGLVCTSTDLTPLSKGTCQQPLTLGSICVRNIDCGDNATCEAGICVPVGTCNASYVLDGSLDPCDSFELGCFCNAADSASCYQSVTPYPSEITGVPKDDGTSSLFGSCQSTFEKIEKTKCNNIIRPIILDTSVESYIGDSIPVECRDMLAEISCCILCSFDEDLDANVIAGGAAPSFTNLIEYSKFVFRLIVPSVPGARPDISVQCDKNNGKGELTFPDTCTDGNKDRWSLTIRQVQDDIKCNDFATSGPVSTTQPPMDTPEPMSPCALLKPVLLFALVFFL